MGSVYDAATVRIEVLPDALEEPRGRPLLASQLDQGPREIKAGHRCAMAREVDGDASGPAAQLQDARPQRHKPLDVEGDVVRYGR